MSLAYPSADRDRPRGVARTSDGVELRLFLMQMLAALGCNGFAMVSARAQLDRFGERTRLQVSLTPHGAVPQLNVARVRLPLHSITS